MWIKHLKIICVLGFAVFLIGHFIPNAIDLKIPMPLSEIPEYPVDSSAYLAKIPDELDSTVYLEELEEFLSPIRILPPHKKQPSRWELAKGIPLPVHMLEFVRFTQKKQCKIFRSIENGKKKFIALEFQCPNASRKNIRIQHGKKYTENASKLALILNVKKFSIAELSLLKKFKEPISFLIDPISADPSVFYDIDKIDHRDILLNFPLEPQGYPFINPGKHTLLIHQSQAHIESQVDKAYSKLPEAVGVVGTYGTQAVEQEGFLHKIFSAIQGKGLSWIQIHSGGKEKVTSLCNQFEFPCYKADRPKNSADVITKALHLARKKGDHMIILPLKLDILQKILDARNSAKLQGTTFVNASELIKQENP